MACEPFDVYDYDSPSAYSSGFLSVIKYNRLESFVKRTLHFCKHIRIVCLWVIYLLVFPIKASTTATGLAVGTGNFVGSGSISPEFTLARPKDYFSLSATAGLAGEEGESLF